MRTYRPKVKVEWNIHYAIFCHRFIQKVFQKSQNWSTYAGTCTIYTNACGAVPAITWTGTWGTWETFASKATNASNTGIQIGRDRYLYYMRATNSKPFNGGTYDTEIIW